MSRSPATLACLLLACGAPKGPSSPPGPCASQPKPDPSYVCAQACGPAVVRPDTPAPGYVWADPAHVRDGQVFPCPKCLPASARIATPSGPVRVIDVREGMLVWSTDRAGSRVARRVIRIGSTPVGAGHLLARLTLADGRQVTASPEHPLADGRRIGGLAVGDSLMGASVVGRDLIPYDGGATYDILPAGETGAYWVDGVLVGSTLEEP